MKSVLKNIVQFIITLSLSSVYAQETNDKETSIVLKTNVAYFFQGIPLTAEVGLGKKQSIVADVVFTLQNEYKDQLFFRGSIHHRVAVGFRQYFVSKKAKNSKKFEGLYLQPTIFYSKNTKYKTNAFSAGLCVGGQFRVKKSMVIDLGVGLGILNDKNSEADGYFSTSYNMIQPKLGIGWVIK